MAARVARTPMHSVIRQPLLKYLASISIAIGAGLDPAPSLEQLPEDVVSDLADEVARTEWESTDRKRLLRLLAGDPRASVRARVAGVAGAVCEPTCEGARDILGELATDPSQRVRQAVADGLAVLLNRADPCERTAIGCDWVLAPEPRAREVVAASLGLRAQRAPIVLSDMMLEVLATDPDAKVRARAASALAQAFVRDAGADAAILRRLIDDPDPHVRSIARSGLGTAFS